MRARPGVVIHEGTSRRGLPLSFGLVLIMVMLVLSPMADAMGRRPGHSPIPASKPASPLSVSIAPVSSYGSSFIANEEVLMRITVSAAITLEGVTLSVSSGDGAVMVAGEPSATLSLQGGQSYGATVGVRVSAEGGGVVRVRVDGGRDGSSFGASDAFFFTMPDEVDDASRRQGLRIESSGESSGESSAEPPQVRETRDSKGRAIIEYRAR